MSQPNTSILYIVTKDGHCQSVQLSMDLWNKVENHVVAVAASMQPVEDPFAKPEPLDGLRELKEFWDFTYPFEGHVHCDSCGASTEDFENDASHPFHLTNANFGGLLVFLCRCGATVRKKHFHRKVVFECTPA